MWLYLLCCDWHEWPRGHKNRLTMGNAHNSSSQKNNSESCDCSVTASEAPFPHFIRLLRSRAWYDDNKVNRELHLLAINETNHSPGSDVKVQMLTSGVRRMITTQEDKGNLFSCSKDKPDMIDKKVFAKNFRLLSVWHNLCRDVSADIKWCTTVTKKKMA